MKKLIDANGLPVDIQGNTPDGDGYVNVAPFVTADGVPKVVVMVRLDSPSSYEATIDGHPAVAFFLGQDGEGKGNAPWELGHLLAETWHNAEQLAKTQKSPR